MVQREQREAFECLTRKVVVLRGDIGEEDVGDFPPSSSVTGIMFSEAYYMISRPVVLCVGAAIIADERQCPDNCTANCAAPFRCVSRVCPENPGRMAPILGSSVPRGDLRVTRGTDMIDCGKNFRQGVDTEKVGAPELGVVGFPTVEDPTLPVAHDAINVDA